MWLDLNFRRDVFTKFYSSLPWKLYWRETTLAPSSACYWFSWKIYLRSCHSLYFESFFLVNPTWNLKISVYRETPCRAAYIHSLLLTYQTLKKNHHIHWSPQSELIIVHLSYRYGKAERPCVVIDWDRPAICLILLRRIAVSSLGFRHDPLDRLVALDRPTWYCRCQDVCAGCSLRSLDYHLSGTYFWGSVHLIYSILTESAYRACILF